MPTRSEALRTSGGSSPCARIAFSIAWASAVSTGAYQVSRVTRHSLPFSVPVASVVRLAGSNARDVPVAVGRVATAAPPSPPGSPATASVAEEPHEHQCRGRGHRPAAGPAPSATADHRVVGGYADLDLVGGVGQQEGDVAVAHVVVLLPVRAHHCRPPCVTMSASWGMARSFAIPLAALLFTEPIEQPIASAVWVSVRSSQ